MSGHYFDEQPGAEDRGARSIFGWLLASRLPP